MPYCPKCRFEYLPEVKTCPECGAALVAVLAPEAPHPPRTEEEMEEALLGVVGGSIHAQLLQQELAAQGIASRAQPGWSDDELLGTVEAPPPPFGGSEGGSVAVFVYQHDLARAKIVMDDFERVGIETEAEEPPETEGEGQ
jgi:hypothetical protein